MTMDDVYSKMHKKLEEEKTDSDVYCEMADCAEKAGKEDLAFGLWMIAADEKTHEEFLRQYMDEENMRR